MTASGRYELASVLMPTYGQASFVERAIDSLCRQSWPGWELIVIDDGSPDDTAAVVEPYLTDTRIRYVLLERNTGPGAALNRGLEIAQGDLIAYLPSDDVYYADHLVTLAHLLRTNDEAVLAYSGLYYHYNRQAEGRIPGLWLQLVQVMHRRTDDRWTERGELVSDDLDRLFWHKLESKGTFVPSGRITCEWVHHPDQLHKVIQEPEGGINTYRAKFRVQEPMRFHSTRGNFIDEVELYRPFRERPDTPKAPDGLTILLCGELAYSPERVLALEERGHKLYGLWMPEPYWYNSVGPLPFGHVADLPSDCSRSVLDEIKPDIIYALLNWQAVPFVHEVLSKVENVPLVWHFKEGPFICLEKGTWAELVDLYTRSAGVIYCSPEMQAWTELTIPPSRGQPHTLVLDGDLPKADWFTGDRSERISQREAESGGSLPAKHTVVPGRPIGLRPENVAELADQNIHLHFYGDFSHGQWTAWIDRVRKLAPDHLHLHGQVDQRGWVKEFSQYDAGWLHYVPSRNGGDIARADWDDLNYPARLPMLVAAGLPILHYDNSESIFASHQLVESLNMGLAFRSMEELRAKLDDETLVEEVRRNVWASRSGFTFDAHADRLVEFFRQVIAG